MAWIERRRKEEELRGINTTGRFTNKDYSKLEYLPTKIKAKRITVYVNGDMTRGGIQIPIPNTVKKFPHLLDLVTRAVGMLGHCHYIYTHSGRRLSSINELRHGHVYVAAGAEPFKKLAYNPKALDHLRPPKDVERAGYRQNEVDYHERMDRLHGCFEVKKIKIFTMSETRDPVDYLVTVKDQMNFDNFLISLNEKIRLPPPGNGAIRTLYDMSGEEVLSTQQFEASDYLLATGNFGAGHAAVQRRVGDINRLSQSRIKNGKQPAYGTDVGRPRAMQLPKTVKQVSNSSDGSKYSPQNLHKLLQMKDTVYKTARDHLAVGNLWKKIQGKWVDNNRQPTATLSATRAACIQRFKVLNIPICWETAYIIYSEDFGNKRHEEENIHRPDLEPLIVTVFCVHVAMVAMDDHGDRADYSFSDFENLLDKSNSMVGHESLKAKRKVFSSVAFCLMNEVDDSFARSIDIYKWYTHSEQLDRYPNTIVGSYQGDQDDAWSFSTDFEITPTSLPNRASPGLAAPQRIEIIPLSKNVKRRFKILAGHFHDAEKTLREVFNSVLMADEFFDQIDSNSNGILDANEINSNITREFPVLNHQAALKLTCRISLRAKVIAGLAQHTGKYEPKDTCITVDDFPEFMRNLLYFNKVLHVLGVDDEHDGNCFLTIDDFKHFQQRVLGVKMNDKRLQENFNLLLNEQPDGVAPYDSLLLETLCLWYAETQFPLSLMNQITEHRPPSPSGSKRTRRKSKRVSIFTGVEVELAAIEHDIDTMDLDSFDLLSSWLANTTSTDHVEHGLVSYASMSESEIVQIVAHVTQFSTSELNELAAMFLDTKERIGRAGLNSLLVLCSAVRRIPSSLRAWQQKFDLRYCIRVAKKLCPAANRESLVRELTSLSTYGEGSTMTIEPSQLIKWCIHQMYEYFQMHLMFIDTERAALQLGSDAAIVDLIRQCDHDATGAILSLSDMVDVISNHFSALNDEAGYVLAFQIVTGRNDEPLMKVGGKLRDVGSTQLSTKEFRQFVFTVLCVHKLAVTLRLDLQAHRYGRDELLLRELTYGEFCLGLDCIGVDPRPGGNLSSRAFDYNSIRHNRSSNYNGDVHDRGTLTFSKLACHCAHELYLSAQRDFEVQEKLANSTNGLHLN